VNGVYHRKMITEAPTVTPPRADHWEWIRARIIIAGFAGLFWAWPQIMTAREIDLPGPLYKNAAVSQVAQAGPQDSSAKRGAIAQPVAKHAEIISRFIALIDDHRVGDALAMMSPELLPDADRVAWTRQFAAIKSIHVMDIRPADTGRSGPCFEYKVTLKVDVSSEAANEPIPYFGWDDNPNLRWIELCPSGDSWLISSIGTGP